MGKIDSVRTADAQPIKSIDAILKRNQGKHVWMGGLLEMVGKRPYCCIKCSMTMSELALLPNGGTCQAESTPSPERGMCVRELKN